MTTVLRLSGLNKSFPGSHGPMQVLSALDLQIQENSFVTLLGASGCGKTTVLRIVAGLEQADAGQVLLDGRDITGLPAYQRPVNMVFQSYALFPHLRVSENIAFGLRMRKKPRAEIAAAVAANLERVQLSRFADRYPAQLSGGQQQRVALARALINEPRVLLLDEPLSALDFKLRREMQGELKRLQRSSGITFMFVTHDQNEALSLSDDIVVLNGGRIEQQGSPEQIYRQPASRFVATFVGECNVLPAAVLGLGEGEIAFRPEDVSLGGDGYEGSGTTAGYVLEVSYQGSSTLYRVRCDSGSEITVVQSQEPRRFSTGERVRASVKREGLMQW